MMITIISNDAFRFTTQVHYICIRYKITRANGREVDGAGQTDRQPGPRLRGVWLLHWTAYKNSRFAHFHVIQIGQETWRINRRRELLNTEHIILKEEASIINNY